MSFIVLLSYHYVTYGVTIISSLCHLLCYYHIIMSFIVLLLYHHYVIYGVIISFIVIIIVIRLQQKANHFPFHLHIVHLLISLTNYHGCYVPIATILIEVSLYFCSYTLLQIH